MVKLLPTDEQRQLLYKTLERANAACNFISEQMWAEKTFGRTSVSRLTYHETRAEFQTGSELTVRCINKVVDAYSLDKKTKRLFKKLGAIPFSTRNLRFRFQQKTVSIALLGGRESISYLTGEYHDALLQYQSGESDLVYRKGKFYLYATCDIPDEALTEPEGWLGVDLGVNNIAVDSTGEKFAANHLLNVRHRHRHLRKKLQAKGTKSAKRRLKHLSGKEKRFASDVNHCISKHLVKKAKGTRSGIALEELTHIQTRVTVQRRRRDQLHSWAFAQLRAFISYKAQRAGIAVEFIDARYTSQQCSCCGHTSRSNRPNQATFHCTSCGFVSHADVNAARNISGRAAVSPPYAVCVLGLVPATTANSRL